MSKIVGILALQGDVIEHVKAIQSCSSDSESIETVEVRTINDLEKVSALIIPGGESTTIGKLLIKTKLDEAIKQKARQGLPIYGTCAGAIILAKSITGPQQADNLKLIDIEIQRNGYGRQLDSFITDIPVSEKVSTHPINAVFIRAPIITKLGENTEVLAECEGNPVLVQEENILVSTFHPELTNDNTVHRYFLDMIG